MHVKPKDDSVLLRDPVSRVRVPPEGANVPDSNFWHRRVREGSAIVTTAARVVEAKASAHKRTKRAPAGKTPERTTQKDD